MGRSRLAQEVSAHVDLESEGGLKEFGELFVKSCTPNKSEARGQREGGGQNILSNSSKSIRSSSLKSRCCHETLMCPCAIGQREGGGRSAGRKRP
jgi:hypothetical protein